PRAQPAHWKRRRLDMRQARRLRREDRRRNAGVIRGDAVTIERRQRKYLLAGLDDQARQLVRGHRRHSICRPFNLATRTRARMQLHENLAFPRSRTLDLLYPETVWIQVDDAHR